MSISDVIQIGISCIISAGGVSGIIILAVKFTSGIIADRLEKKYELKLQKELENYKLHNSKKEYVSKTRFDAEFEIYRKLGKVFFEMVKAVSTMIPNGLTFVKSDKGEREKEEYEHFINANNAVVYAQDCLLSEIAFVQEDIYDGYDEILGLCITQVYTTKLKKYNLDMMASKNDERYMIEDYERTTTINKKWKELNHRIRDYLSNLEIARED